MAYLTTCLIPAKDRQSDTDTTAAPEKADAVILKRNQNTALLMRMTGAIVKIAGTAITMLLIAPFSKDEYRRTRFPAKKPDGTLLTEEKVP